VCPIDLNRYSHARAATTTICANAATRLCQCTAANGSPLSYATAATYSDQQWRERASPQTQPQFVIALSQGQAIGLIGDAVNASGEYNLIAMWIRPQDRGMGIAGRLVNAIQARAIERGHQRIVLSVSPDNADAVSMYRRQGFTFLPEWEPLASQPGVNVQKMEWKSDR